MTKDERRKGDHSLFVPGPSSKSARNFRRAVLASFQSATHGTTLCARSEKKWLQQIVIYSLARAAFDRPAR
jgi:hypothetical protein